MPRRLLVLVALVLVACGGDDGAAIDAPITVDIDNGSCGSDLRFTGEYIDWDADTTFCGVNEALFQVQGDGAMDSTAPNGRFDLCVPNGAAQVILDVTPSADPSECTNPGSPYPHAGIVVATRAVILAGGVWSGRNFTTAREATIGATLDPAKAHVFVHVDGTPRAVSIDGTSDAPQANAATTWAPGDTGHDVFFSNVVVGGGTTTVSVAGGAIGQGSVPLAAGKITSVSVLAN